MGLFTWLSYHTTSPYEQLLTYFSVRSYPVIKTIFTETFSQLTGDQTGPRIWGSLEGRPNQPPGWYLRCMVRG